MSEEELMIVDFGWKEVEEDGRQKKKRRVFLRF
jgi:hypothetical protein